MVLVNLTDWLRDRLHDVSSTFTDLSSYMKLAPYRRDGISVPVHRVMQPF